MLHFFLLIIAGAIAIPLLIACLPLALVIAGVALLVMHQTVYGLACLAVAALVAWSIESARKPPH